MEENNEKTAFSKSVNDSMRNDLKNIQNLDRFKPSPIYVSLSWLALGIAILFYCIGLWNAEISLSEKGFYFTILLFGLFAAVALQKSVRDKLEGVPVTSLFLAIGWIGTFASITLLTVGLINAEMLLSEKGFYALAYILALFASVSVQKNVRDLENLGK